MVPRLKPSIQRHQVLAAGPRCPPGGPASDELRPGRADAIYDLGCIDFYIHTHSTVYIIYICVYIHIYIYIYIQHIYIYIYLSIYIYI